ncbi:MAG: hypothetical protein U5L09_15140, partial [Bacteroidales bacterium]|nr:hypothetical protein [Bacteroidales bacterium]
MTYQPGQKDQFIQKHLYDEDRRLKKILTSRYGYIWDEDVKMYYYPHGPVARVEYGEEKVQGIDHAYTLQGWSKGMNASTISPSDDIGKDGVANNIFSNVARDAVSLVFDYNQNDYTSIDGKNHF